MDSSITSVSDAFQRLTNSQQQFTTVTDAWYEFLAYLQNRRGADIRSVRRIEELDAAIRFIDEGNLSNGETASSDPQIVWFRKFERREDVLEGLQKFIQHRQCSAQGLS